MWRRQETWEALGNEEIHEGLWLVILWFRPRLCEGLGHPNDSWLSNTPTLECWTLHVRLRAGSFSESFWPHLTKMASSLCPGKFCDVPFSDWVMLRIPRGSSSARVFCVTIHPKKLSGLTQHTFIILWCVVWVHQGLASPDWFQHFSAGFANTSAVQPGPYPMLDLDKSP